MTIERKVMEGRAPDVRVYHCHEVVGADSIRDAIKLLPGVEVVYISERYCVTVRKSPIWTWEEVEPAIVEFLRPMDLRLITMARQF